MATYKRGKTPLPNRLWNARKCRGLGQKQVSTLLKYKQIEQLSRFEKGVRLPSLRHALALEIVYGIPVRSLFSGLYAELQEDLRKRAGKQVRELLSELSRRDESPGVEDCPCEEILRIPLLTQEERDRVRDHVTHLARQLARL